MCKRCVFRAARLFARQICRQRSARPEARCASTRRWRRRGGGALLPPSSQQRCVQYSGIASLHGIPRHLSPVLPVRARASITRTKKKAPNSLPCLLAAFAEQHIAMSARPTVPADRAGANVLLLVEQGRSECCMLWAMLLARVRRRSWRHGDGRSAARVRARPRFLFPFISINDAAAARALFQIIRGCSAGGAPALAPTRPTRHPTAMLRGTRRHPEGPVRPIMTLRPCACRVAQHPL